VFIRANPRLKNLSVRKNSQLGAALKFGKSLPDENRKLLVASELRFCLALNLSAALAQAIVAPRPAASRQTNTPHRVHFFRIVKERMGGNGSRLGTFVHVHKVGRGRD